MDKLNEIKIRLAKGMSQKDIARDLDITYQNIQYYRKKYGLVSPKIRYKKYSLNEEYFKIIDTPEKAYILGFTAADGCLYKNSTRFGYCLAETDLEILEFIKQELNSEAPIKIRNNTKGAKNRKPQALLRISSQPLKDDLKTLGLRERKTFLSSPIPEIPYKNAFILGYFDGDGHIGIKSGKYKRASFTNGDNTILRSIQEELLNSGVGKLNLYHRPSINSWVLETANQAIIKKLKLYLYDNSSSFYLKRKYNLFC